MEVTTIQTDRLMIRPLEFKDDAFILELVNTEGWLVYIGNKNIYTLADAQNYIQNILTTPNCFYWTVVLKETSTPIGLINLLQRTYLPNADFGFAFLPQYANKGYALEATSVVLEDILQQDENPSVLAITLTENKNSIKLLNRLGFIKSKEIEIEEEALYLFEIKKDKK